MTSLNIKLNLRWIPFLIFGILLINGCRKDEHTTDTGGPIFPNPTTTIESRLEGLILDVYGEPLQGVTIDVENKEATSDENGFFRLTRLPLRAGGSLVKATMEGYIIGYKTVYPHYKSSSYVEFTLIKKASPETFRASTGGTVTTKDGATITFPADGIIYESGGKYNGDVKVYSHWYDPLLEETARTMPGNLNGQNTDGEEVQLQSFGMINVDLIATDGKKLQLAEGIEAEIKFPKLGTTQGAPDDLPLWHFDEDYGVWVEEGTATLNGDYYSGKVSHFSFWNCDVGIPLVEIEGRLLDPNGIPVANHPVYVRLNNWFGGYEFTNSLGKFKGKVPQNRQLNLKVYHCGVELVDEAIGPFMNDTDLGDYEVQLTDYAFPLTGRFIDCGDQPNPNAYGVAKYKLISANSDGTFGTIVAGCGESTTTIALVDPVSNSHKKQIIPTNQASVDLGDVKLCDLTGAYIAFTIDGDYASVATDPRATFYDDNVYIRNYTGNQDGVYFQTDFKGQGLGTFNPFQINLSSILFEGEKQGSLNCSDDEDTSCDDFEITISQTGTIGDTLKGSFSGKLYLLRDTINGATGSDVHLVEGSFNIPIIKDFNSITVKGRLWIDENNDGIQDGNETFTKPNNFFSIRKPNGSNPDFGRSYAYTDADGNYEFTGIEPGEYFISANLPRLSQLTVLNAGGDDTKDSDFYEDVNYYRTSDLFIADGETVENIDMGVTIPDFQYNQFNFYGCTPDINLKIYINGGVEPFTFELSDGQSNNNGFFEITNGGNYSVTVTDAFNRSVTGTNIIVENYSNFISVSAFEDSNTGQPDVSDSSDKTYKGLKFKLFDENGGLIEEGLNNDPSGFLRFSYIEPGKYYVEIEVPTGYDLVLKDIGTNEYADSDFDPATARTDVFEIIDCNTNIQLGAGLRKQ